MSDHEVEMIKPDGVIEEIKKPTDFKVGIGQQGGYVFIEFTKEVKKLMMRKDQAKEFARRIIQECLR